MSHDQKTPHPPKWANKLLQWVYREHYMEEIQGDLYELFYRRVEANGIKKAQRMYWADVLRFIWPSTKKRKQLASLSTSPSLMIHLLPSGLKIAFRNLLKHKSISLINILGLAIGVVCMLLASIYVHYHTNFDTYHQDAHLLYRVEINEWAGAPFGLSTHLQEDYPQVQKASRLFLPLQSALLGYGEKTFTEKKFYYADATLFELFTFEFIQGDPLTALTKPGSVVISQGMAEKYFGEANPLLQTINLLANGKTFPYLVTGVFKDTPPQTHFSAHFIASISTLTVPEKIKWTDYVYHTYVKLVTTKQNPIMARELASHIGKLQPKGLHTEQIKVTFRPVVDIHLHSYKERELGANSSSTTLYILALAALFVLLMGCINFITMATATSLGRAKEVGLRKAIGAFRDQLIGQFMGEAFIIVLLSVLVGTGLTAILLPSFGSFARLPKSEWISEAKQSMYMLPLIISVATLLSGLYPAFYISRYSASSLLKKGIELSSSSGNYARKGFLILQLVIAACLINGSLIVYSQLAYLQEANIGISKEQILLIPTNAEVKKNYHTFKKELLKYSNISHVSASYNVPGQRIIMEKFAPASDLNQTNDLRVVVSDFDFIETYGLEVIKGRSFSKEHYADSLGAFVINEQAAAYFGWQQPLGQKIHFPLLNTTGEVIGVVRDFHYASLHSSIEPLLLYVSPNKGTYSYVSVRFKGDQLASVRKAIKETYGELFPTLPFEVEFLDENFRALYEAEEQLNLLAGIFSILSTGLACFGLLGLVSLTIGQKRKEIAVRKVLGASILSLVLRFYKQYGWLLFISLLLAPPMVYYLLNEWLSGFAYRITIPVRIFCVSGLLLTVITFLTIAYQIIKAVVVKPTHWLREA